MATLKKTIIKKRQKSMKVKSNLVLRTVSGLIFVAMLVGLPFVGELMYRILFLVLGLGIMDELIGLINKSGKAKVGKITPILGYVIISGVFGGLRYASEESLELVIFILAFVLLLLFVFAAELYRKKAEPINDLAYWAFTQLYVALPFGIIQSLPFIPVQGYVPEYSPLLPLAMFAFIWSTDTGAFCVGSLIGKRKLFPRISPNKSWEGAIGGVVIAMIVGYVFSIFFDILNVYQWIGLAFVVSVSGIFGDLVESLLKRTWGIKDSGSIMPGHGGFLDRFDSSLFAIPVTAFYLYCIAALG